MYQEIKETVKPYSYLPFFQAGKYDGGDYYGKDKKYFSYCQVKYKTEREKAKEDCTMICFISMMVTGKMINMTERVSYVSQVRINWQFGKKKDGDRYEGEFKKGKFNGNGVLYYSNKSYYKGEFQDDAKEGNGTETYPNGSVYTGQFSKDKPHGKGVLVKGEYSYEGEFVDGLKEGQGKEHYKLATYEGQFFKGFKHGKGKWAHHNGNNYGNF